MLSAGGCWGLMLFCTLASQRSLSAAPSTTRLHPPLPARPCAAASLGQVYRGVLRSTGEAVAVKVQRPGVATSIALDVYVLRLVRAAEAAGEAKAAAGRAVQQ